MPRPGSPATTVRLPPDLFEVATLRARREGTTVSGLLRRGLTLVLTGELPPTDPGTGGPGMGAPGRPRPARRRVTP